MGVPPNKIKYTSSFTENTIKAKNFVLGIKAGKNYGPTSSTGFWNGITPPTNGYTIIFDKTIQGPSIFVASNDADLINFAKYFGGNNINSVSDALYFFDSNNDRICVNIDHPDITTDGLVMSLDAGYTLSYLRSGSTWYDSSFSGYNATLINSPTFSLSAGGILTFSATSSNYATIPDFGNFSNGFTLEAWVYFNSIPTSNTYPAIITNAFSGGSYVGYSLGVMNTPWDGKITGGFYNGTWKISSGFAPSVNTWYHFVTTYDNTNVKLYKDGVLYSQNNVGSSSISSGLGGYIAKRWDTSDYIDGSIPIVRVYNRALTDSEITINYNSTKTRYQTQDTPYLELNDLSAYLRNYMSEFRNPSFYTYRLDGTGVYINDGGSDMYDNGNFTTPWLLSGVAYTGNSGTVASFPSAINYTNTGSTTADTSLYYVSLGYVQYNGVSQVNTYHPLTVIGSRSTQGHAVGWQIGGNSGADGGGTLSSGLIYSGTSLSGFTTYAFYRETYNATDPSHCNLFILLGHTNWNSTFGTIHTSADPVSNGGCGSYLFTSGASVNNIVAIQTLLSKSGGALVTSGECQTVVQNFVGRIKTYFNY